MNISNQLSPKISSYSTGQRNVNYLKKIKAEKMGAQVLRGELNKETLTAIFNEILEVSRLITISTSVDDKKILINRYRYLADKYAYASPDELVTYN